MAITDQADMPVAAEANPPEIYSPLYPDHANTHIPICHLIASTPAWAVARTAPRMERRLAWHLRENQVAYILPFEWHYDSNSRRRYLRPLLEGFVFFGQATPNAQCIEDEATRTIARQSRSVYGFLNTANQPKLKNELLMLVGEPTAQRTLEITAENLPEGELAEVTDGPFKGLTGTLCYSPSGHNGRSHINVFRIWIQSVLLGRTLSCEVDPRVVRVL